MITDHNERVNILFGRLFDSKRTIQKQFNVNILTV